MLLRPFPPGYYHGTLKDGRAFTVWASAGAHATRLQLVKAEGLQPGERWITLKPHGPDHPSYVHVKIRENPDGSAHVLTGPGELRGLKLTRGPAKAKPPKAKPPKREETPEQKAARSAAEDAIKRRLDAVQAEAVKAASALTDDPTFEKLLEPGLKDALKAKVAAAIAPGDASAKHAAGVAAANATRALDTAIGKLTRNVIGELVADDELRAAVLAPGDSLSASDAAPAPRGGPGYQANAQAEAAKRGFTAADAKAESDDFFEARIAQLREDGEGDKADRAVAARARMQAVKPLLPVAGSIAKEEVPTPDARVDATALKAKAEAARKLLQAQQAKKALERELRRVRLGGDPDASPAEVQALSEVLDDPGMPFDVAYEEVDPALRDKLEAAIQSAAAEDLTRSFLEALEDDSGEVGADVRQQLQGPLAAGAYAHLNNALLASLGVDSLDRRVVDVLGVNAAAQLAAHALLRDLPEGQHERLVAGLGAYHDEVSLSEMRDALARASAAREEAANIEVPPITDGEDAAIAMRLLEDKREHLAEAHKALGNALGRVEAGAALNLALQGRRERVLAGFGATPVATAALNLRALGLSREHYEWHKDASGNLWARINKAGMDALTPKADAGENELRQAISDIKAGLADEDDWLPAGFERYSRSDLAGEAPLPEAYARSWGVVSDPDDARDMRERVTELIATRLADGWSESEVARHFTRLDLISAHVPSHEQDAFRQAVAELLPATDGSVLRTAKDGSKYEEPVYVDYDNLHKHPQVAQRLKEAADGWLKANRPEVRSYAEQQLPDNEQSAKALHMTLVADPRTQAALKAPTELTEPDKRAIRSYWLSDVAGVTPEKLAASHAQVKQAEAAFEERNPPPPKWVAGGGGLFGGDAPAPTSATLRFADASKREAALAHLGLSSEQGHFVEPGDGSVVLTPAGMQALRPPSGEYARLVTGLEELSGEYVDWQRRKRQAGHEAADIESLPEWTSFVERVGGTHRAYEAVQEHMQGVLASSFAANYARVTGTPLKLGRASNTYGEALLALTDPELDQQLKELTQQAQEQSRQREGGRFAYMGGRGAVAQAARELLAARKAAESAQASLFGGAGGGGDDSAARDELLPGLERHALPAGVTARLKAMSRHVAKNLDPAGSGVKLIPDMTMGKGTRFVKQQRAIKANLAAKKMALFLGVGSGKTAVSIGMFTELHHRGQAKKGMYVVPSIVRDQFGEEMARTLKPGAYNWHAREASYEERLKHYQNPDTHMLAVTHQSFRDDMLRLMAEHHGEGSVTSMTQRFMDASPQERLTLLKAALDARGIPLDYLAVDEAHDALNRAGKAESNLSAVLDAAMQLSQYGTLMTGSPVKNDESELHDWLKKVAPDRFGDREEFHRKYGVDVHASREALKRVADRYTYHDVVPAQTTKSVTWGGAGAGSSPSGHAPVALTAWQQERLSAVDAAYQQARRARRQGRVEVAALRLLSPNSFEGLPEEQHAAVAERLQHSLGTLRHAATERVINAAPPEHNAKLQHLLALADERRGKGGVVFAHSRATVEMTRQALERAGHKVAVLTGSDSARDKARIRRALDRGEVDIVVASDAGSTGANFQGRGEWLVNVDLPMTQKTMEQRNARIDRLGQTRAIELHHLMSDSDFDRDNYRRLERKRSLGELFQGESEVQDDTGLAKYLSLTRANRPPEANDAAVSLF